MKHAEIIKKMTLQEKAALLSGRDVWHTRPIERLSIPSITLSDGPGGLRKQAGEGDHLGLNASTPATCIPAAAAIANSWSTEVARTMGCVVGQDAFQQGVDILLGPGLNTKRSPLCGRSFEYYSEDPYLAGKLAAGYIQGVQSQGVAACAKHLAANSQELLRMHSDSVMDERTLRELYLTNFEIAVREGKPRAVMTSYNRLNGVYTNENAHLLKDILRGEWDYDGIVVTDWGGSNDFVEGVRAGMNLEMPAAGDDSPVQLVNAVREGRMDEATVDRRVDELLSLILREKRVEPVAPADSREAVRTAAEKCAVLLKNDGNLLPLRKDARVAAIGDFVAHPRFQGAGSSMVNAEHTEDVLSLLPEYFPHAVGYAPGFERLDRPNEEMTRQAVEIARSADCVLLYLGLPEGFETEGLDRAHMRLPDNQVELLKQVAAVNRHVIVVLSCGSAVEMPWAQFCQSIVYGCLGGQAAGSAMLRILSGAANPGGKLAETFPLVYEDMPVSHYYPGREYTSEYREGLYVGYRYFTTAKQPVRFPFGFGLSYTRFEYGNLELDAQGASLDVRNCGDVDGDEVVQLYVSLPGAQVFRPERELKGFCRVLLKAGETKKVRLPFDATTFRYFNVKTNAFEIEGGDYAIRIGASSEDIRLQGSIHIDGTNAPDPYGEALLADYRSGRVNRVSDREFEALLERPIPQKEWDRRRPLQFNDTVSQMAYARNPIARTVARSLKKKLEKAIAAGKPDLNLLFIYNIPFRGMAKMMNGAVTMAMAEDILLMANGHFFKGCGRLIHHSLHKPRLNISESKEV